MFSLGRIGKGAFAIACILFAVQIVLLLLPSSAEIRLSKVFVAAAIVLFLVAGVAMRASSNFRSR